MSDQVVDGQRAGGSSVAGAQGVAVGESLEEDGASSGCSRVVVRDGLRVCADTGVVLGEQVFDEGVDWNPLRDRERGVRRERAGAPLSWAKRDLGAGAELEWRRGGRAPRGRAGRPPAWGLRGPASREEARLAELLRIHADILHRLGRFDVAELREESARLARAGLQLALKERSRVTTRELAALSAAAILRAAEEYSLPITRHEIASAAGVTEREIWLATRLLSRAAPAGAHRAPPSAVDPLTEGLRGVVGCWSNMRRVATFVQRGTAALGLPPALAQRTLQVLSQVLAKGRKSLCGRSPEAVAAAAIYLTASLYDFKVSQKDVAKALGIREATLRKQYRYLLDKVFIIVYL